jgi:hypothetical protein
MMVIHRIGGIVCLIIAMLIVSFSPSPACAELNIKELPGNIHLGPVRIHPQFSVTEVYTDNFFLDPRDEKYNWTTVLTPGITLQVPLKRHTFQLDYRSDIFKHCKYSYYDTEDHYVNGLFNFDFPWGLEVTLGDQFIKSATPPNFEGDSQDDYYHNEGMIEAAYRFANRYKVKLAYRNILRDFWDWEDEVDNYVRNEVSASVYYRLLPKTSVLAEYTFYHMDNEERFMLSTDNYNHHIWVGVEWEPGAKIKGGIKGGYILRRYDEFGRDEDNFGMRGDITYAIGSNTTLTAVATREIIQTSVTAEEGPYGTHYIRTGGNLSLSHTFPFRITATAEGFYYNDDYRERGVYTKNREDDRYGGGVTVGYQFRKWLGFKLGYRFIENQSNFDWEDYRENRGFFQAYLVL